MPGESQPLLPARKDEHGRLAQNLGDLSPRERAEETRRDVRLNGSEQSQLDLRNRGADERERGEAVLRGLPVGRVGHHRDDRPALSLRPSRREERRGRGPDVQLRLAAAGPCALGEEPRDREHARAALEHRGDPRVLWRSIALEEEQRHALARGQAEHELGVGLRETPDHHLGIGQLLGGEAPERAAPSRRRAPAEALGGPRA